jgi:putative thioredoxin
MSTMTENSGAIDLSALKAKAEATPATGGAVSYVQEVTDAEFNSLASRSLKHPVIIELTLPSAPETHQVDQDLISLTNAAGGRWLLGRVDVSKSPAIAQALGVQAVPTVIAIIGGQVAPLFQGTADKQQISQVLEQVVQAAVASGVAGRANPVEGGLVAEGEESGQSADPRFAAADAAIEKGDFATAEAELDKILASSPHDPEALAAKAQVGLLRRTAGADSAAAIKAADANKHDIEAQLQAADFELLGGQTAAGFRRLLDVIRSTTGPDRDRARVRLIELLSTVPGDDPLVQKTRRDLAAALF